MRENYKEFSKGWKPMGGSFEYYSEYSRVHKSTHKFVWTFYIFIENFAIFE